MPKHESPAYNEYPGFELPEITDNDYETTCNLFHALLPEEPLPTRKEVAEMKSNGIYEAWLESIGVPVAEHTWQNS